MKTLWALRSALFIVFLAVTVVPWALVVLVFSRSVPALITVSPV